MAAQQNGSPILEVEHEEIPRNMVIQQMNPAMSWLYRSHALSLPIAELMETCLGRRVLDIPGFQPGSVRTPTVQQLMNMGAPNHSILPRLPLVPSRFRTHEVIDDNDYLVSIGTIRIKLDGREVGGRPHTVLACFNIFDNCIAVTGTQPTAIPFIRLVTIGTDERMLRFPAETHIIEGVQYEGFEIFNWTAVSLNATMRRYLDQPALRDLDKLYAMWLSTFMRLQNPFKRTTDEHRALPRFGSPEVAPLVRALIDTRWLHNG